MLEFFKITASSLGCNKRNRFTCCVSVNLLKSDLQWKCKLHNNNANYRNKKNTHTHKTLQKSFYAHMKMFWLGKNDTLQKTEMKTRFTHLSHMTWHDQMEMLAFWGNKTPLCTVWAVTIEKKTQLELHNISPQKHRLFATVFCQKFFFFNISSSLQKTSTETGLQMISSINCNQKMINTHGKL